MKRRRKKQRNGSTRSGFFDRVADAQPSMGGVYFEARGDREGSRASYVVRVRRCIAHITRQGDEAFIVECDIVLSDHPRRPDGSRASWYQKMSLDAAPGNVRLFIAIATDSDIEEVSPRVCEMVVTKDQPLKGTWLELDCEVVKKKRSKGTWLRHTWRLLTKREIREVKEALRG